MLGRIYILPGQTERVLAAIRSMDDVSGQSSICAGILRGLETCQGHRGAMCHCAIRKWRVNPDPAASEHFRLPVAQAKVVVEGVVCCGPAVACGGTWVDAKGDEGVRHRLLPRRSLSTRGAVVYKARPFEVAGADRYTPSQRTSNPRHAATLATLQER